MRTSTRLFFIIGLATLIISACGYRGPLYLPDPAPTSNNTVHAQ